MRAEVVILVDFPISHFVKNRSIVVPRLFLIQSSFLSWSQGFKPDNHFPRFGANLKKITCAFFVVAKQGIHRYQLRLDSKRGVGVLK